MRVTHSTVRPQAGPFHQHLADAISLNRARRPRYAALTQGNSLPISNTLLRLETLSIPAAHLFDHLTAKYRAHDVPVFAAEFVPMPADEPFAEQAALPTPSPAALPPVDLCGWMLALHHALQHQGYPQVVAVANAALEKIAALPQHHCMVRHILESIRRAAQLAPHHSLAAAAAGLGSPDAYSRWFIALQILTLPPSADLDRRAFPIQARGIPILQQDLPVIPPYQGDA